MKSSHKVIHAEQAKTLVYPVLELDDLAYPVTEEPAPQPQWNVLVEEEPALSAEDLVIPQARCITSQGEKQQSVTRWMPELISVLPLGEEANQPATSYVAGRQTEQLVRAAEARARALIENAHRQAEEIVQQAHQEAEEVLFQSQGQIEAALQQARQEGRAAGEIAIRAELEGLLRTSEGILVGVQDWRNRFLAESETIVIDLVKALGRAVFGEGLALDGEALQQNFYRITEAARNLGELKIFVHPDDADRLDPLWVKMRSSIIGAPVQIIPSGNITRGGCFVQGQMGSIDARIETQMRTMLDSLDHANDPHEGER